MQRPFEHVHAALSGTTTHPLTYWGHFMGHLLGDIKICSVHTDPNNQVDASRQEAHPASLIVQRVQRVPEASGP
eukprot:5095628-Pyramimonas_sp.AAC.1